MKRSELKPGKKPIRKSPAKGPTPPRANPKGRAGKKKEHTLPWHKKKAWAAFSKYVRLRDALETTGTPDNVVCCTCHKVYPAFGKGCVQAGHFIPGRRNSILFDESCVHGQCYNCNINLKGNWPEYLPFMERRYGGQTVAGLLELNKQVRKYTKGELDDLRKMYERMYDGLKETAWTYPTE